MKLEEISRGFILRAAINRMSRQSRRQHQLWVLVRNLCGVGSGSAYAICRELGWNPDAPGTDTIPPEAEPVQEKWTSVAPAMEGMYDFRCAETGGEVGLIKISIWENILWVEDSDIGKNPLNHFHDNLDQPEYRFHSKL